MRTRMLRGGRTSEAAMAEASLAAATGMPEKAVACLSGLTERSEHPFAGWTIPLDPLLDPLRARPDFQPLVSALAARAR